MSRFCLDFLVGEIALVLRLIYVFSCHTILCFRKLLPKMIGMDSFEIRKSVFEFAIRIIFCIITSGSNMFKETSITHLLISFVLAGMCGCSKEEVKCSEVPSYDECRKLSHCSAIRFTKTPGTSGPIWACEEKSKP